MVRVMFYQLCGFVWIATSRGGMNLLVDLMVTTNKAFA